MPVSATALLDARPKWLNTFNELFYSSGTVTATGDTGIIATPGVVAGGDARFPLLFSVLGAAIATDETCAVKIDWYADAAGNSGIIGTTTFDTLTASVLTDFEGWPGDVTAYNAGRDLVPLLPFHKITRTLAGTTISLSFQVFISYLKLGA